MAMKQNNLNLKENEKRFLDSFLLSENRLDILEQAIESARNGIVITDSLLPDNPIVYANQAFIDMTGYSMEEVLGKNCRFLQNVDRNQPEIDMLRQSIKNGVPHLATLRNYKKDGSLFWNELSIAPVLDDNGNVVKFIGVQNDVTSRKEAERQVSEFYSVVSHELRTPLSSIRASLELINEGSAGEVSSDAARLVHIAMNNSQRLLKLIDNILDFKKMESGQFQLHLGSIISEEIISEVLLSLSQFADSADVRLTKGEVCHKTISADPNLIRQVLINLIGNAIKFSPPASTIVVTAHERPDGIRFLVSDEGPGIDPEDIDKLFTKFQQLDASDTRLQSGSGLGLAISKTIVELHGGKIGVDSTVGEGSTFWFSLPFVSPS